MPKLICSAQFTVTANLNFDLQKYLFLIAEDVCAELEVSILDPLQVFRLLCVLKGSYLWGHHLRMTIDQGSTFRPLRVYCLSFCTYHWATDLFNIDSTHIAKLCPLFCDFFCFALLFGTIFYSCSSESLWCFRYRLFSFVILTCPLLRKVLEVLTYFICHISRVLGMSTSPDLPLSVLRRTVKEPKSTPKMTLPWTTANLVPEALRANLHVLEDDRMISWLGRWKFVDLCIHGKSGWQDGVSSYVLHLPLNIWFFFGLNFWCPSEFCFCYVLS